MQEMAEAAEIPKINKLTISLAKVRIKRCLIKGGDQNWKDRASRCCKKLLDLIQLKDSRGVFELQKAINTNNSETECILINSGKEPRFWVHRIKYSPHVASWRLWIWPDLQNEGTALQPIEKFIRDDDNCHITVSKKQYEHVCVNPYHYEKAVYVDSADVACVKRLQGYVKKSKDPGWNNRTTGCIEKIVKLSDATGMEKLEATITTENREPTECIIITNLKTNEGAFTVNRLKIWPHVAPCRLWRWPDLKNRADSIKPIEMYEGDDDTCHVKAGSKPQPSENICVNPFHYDRAVDPEKVERLKCHMKVSEDNCWNLTAIRCIEMIVSLLDENRMEKLETAIKTGNKEPSDCIIITRKTKDGKFYGKNNNVRIFPHIASCKAWRWPELMNWPDAIKPNEEYEQSQQHHPHTGLQFSKGHPEFQMCINPFHYQRIQLDFNEDSALASSVN